jgi:GNAT superfamily N-acetyltransferase
MIRLLERHEVNDLWAIDRAEVVDHVYRHVGDRLVLIPEHHDTRGWPPGEQARYAPMLEDCFERGGVFHGAFEGTTFIGAAVLDSRFMGRGGDRLQLKFLHVSRSARGNGVGRRLFEHSLGKARELGARRLYVSSTTSENTVEFYLRRGFCLTDDVDEALLELEPDDIHMELEIPG